MPSLPQGNQGYLEEHLSGQAEQAQLLPLIRAEKDSNSSIPQDPENKGVSQAVTGVKLPDSPNAPTLLRHLSSLLSSHRRLFLCLLRRPPPAARLRPWDFPSQPSSWPTAWLSPVPRRLLFLLVASMALPGRPPRGRRLKLSSPSQELREEDACTGKSSPESPVESEQTEMRMRQMCSGSETQGSVPSQQQGVGGRGSNACCFCWCCCCSCSCLTVRNQEDQRPQRAAHELRTDIPACEESPMPTLEEVCAWAQSFDNLMVTPAGRNAFREFLRTEFSEENMLFWMACEELKREANKSTIEEKARIIYEDYISILSPKEVSLDSRVREVINRNMVDPSQHIFDDAQLQIYTLMHRDSYPRFMNSTVYKDLLKSLAEKAVEA
ncbi:regulator of G-protein signaling 20 isoform 2 [Rattus norvegicus]|uniref:Regulator of G-protein signaling 20 n=1 Tax=Rattus norvegicus TaxID=10116 RepID=A0A8I6GBE3_RAT|nr:regulator of G-protein signaling 20 isoform 2 [Rattus norvegicus]|eukprot:XP_017448954.1 PREDICTED: regulator of G-protein signaling 20 isoform X1 [Rattus norvegicus]